MNSDMSNTGVDTMAPEVFQKKIWSWLEEKGIFSELKTLLRQQMINIIKGTEIGQELSSGQRKKRSLSPKYKAINLLIAEYLLQQGYQYALSIFSSEDPTLIPLTECIPKSTNENDSNDVKINRVVFKFLDTDVLDILETLGFQRDTPETVEINDLYKKSKNDPLINCLLYSISLRLNKDKVMKNDGDKSGSGANFKNIYTNVSKVASTQTIAHDSGNNIENCNTRNDSDVDKLILMTYQEMQIAFNREIDVVRNIERKRCRKMLVMQESQMLAELKKEKEKFKKRESQQRERLLKEIVSEHQKLQEKERTKEIEVERNLQRELEIERNKLLDEFRAMGQNKNASLQTLNELQQSSLEIAMKAVQHQSNRLRKKEDLLNKKMYEFNKSKSHSNDIACQVSLSNEPLKYELQSKNKTIPVIEYFNKGIQTDIIKCNTSGCQTFNSGAEIDPALGRSFWDANFYTKGTQTTPLETASFGCQTNSQIASSKPDISVKGVQTQRDYASTIGCQTDMDIVISDSSSQYNSSNLFLTKDIHRLLNLLNLNNISEANSSDTTSSNPLNIRDLKKPAEKKKDTFGVSKKSVEILDAKTQTGSSTDEKDVDVSIISNNEKLPSSMKNILKNLHSENVYFKAYNDQQRIQIKELLEKQSLLLKEVRDGHNEVHNLSKQLSILKDDINSKTNTTEKNERCRSPEPKIKTYPEYLRNEDVDIDVKGLDKIKETLRKLEQEGEELERSYKEFKHRQIKDVSCPLKKSKALTNDCDISIPRKNKPDESQSNFSTSAFMKRLKNFNKKHKTSTVEEKCLFTTNYSDPIYIDECDSSKYNNMRRVLGPSMNIDNNVLQNYITASHDVLQYTPGDPKSFADMLIRRNLNLTQDESPMNMETQIQNNRPKYTQAGKSFSNNLNRHDFRSNFENTRSYKRFMLTKKSENLIRSTSDRNLAHKFEFNKSVNSELEKDIISNPGVQHEIEKDNNGLNTSRRHIDIVEARNAHFDAKRNEIFRRWSLPMSLYRKSPLSHKIRKKIDSKENVSDSTELSIGGNEEMSINKSQSLHTTPNILSKNTIQSNRINLIRRKLFSDCEITGMNHLKTSRDDKDIVLSDPPNDIKKSDKDTVDNSGIINAARDKYADGSNENISIQSHSEKLSSALSDKSVNKSPHSDNELLNFNDATQINDRIDNDSEIQKLTINENEIIKSNNPVETPDIIISNTEDQDFIESINSSYDSNAFNLIKKDTFAEEMKSDVQIDVNIKPLSEGSQLSNDEVNSFEDPNNLSSQNCEIAIRNESAIMEDENLLNDEFATKNESSIEDKNNESLEKALILSVDNSPMSDVIVSSSLEMSDHVSVPQVSDDNDSFWK